MNFYPRYVTVDEFKNFTGIDLRAALRSDDNVSNQAERFLLQTEDHLMAWIDKNSFRTLDYDHLNEKQLENFKKAILSQALYTYKNGAIALGLESGYDSERGIVTDSDKLAQLEVCQSAINYLSNAGLFNLNIKNRPRVMRGYPGLEQIFPDGGGGPAVNNNQVYGFDPNAYVTLSTNQNISGQKFFAQDILLGNNIGLKAGGAYLIRFDATNDGVAFGKKLVPTSDNTFDIGSSTSRFKNLHLAGYLTSGTNPHGLILPDTTDWTENKIIATLDDIGGSGGGGGIDYQAGEGIVIDGNTISADTTVLATKLDLSNYATTSSVSALSGRVTTIEGLIPAQASLSNPLADQDFVNSSIATNTANFLGTYNIVTDLGLTTSATEQQIASAIATQLASESVTPTNNDYVFVAYPNATVSTQYDKFDRYKYNASLTVWEYEFTLNNSSFTAAQWAAINSGITSDLVNDITNVAPQYSSSSTYGYGDIVVYNHTLYRCKTTISTAESWDSSHWVAITQVAPLDQAFNVINASDITNNTLIQAQYDLITNGKPTLIKGTLDNKNNPMLPPLNNASNSVLVRHRSGICLAEITSSSIHLRSGSGFGRLSLENFYQVYTSLLSVGGKNFPAYPSSPTASQLLGYKPNNSLAYLTKLFENASGFGLTPPDTSAYAADKTIAVTDDADGNVTQVKTQSTGGATSIQLKTWVGTQSQYDSILTKDANTQYIII